MDTFEKILHEFLSAPVASLLLLCLVVALLIIAAPRVVSVMRQLRTSNGAALSNTDIPGVLIEKMRQEARHSASNAVAPALIRLERLERRQDELRELGNSRHAELKGEIAKVVEMVDEMRPLHAQVASLTTSVGFIREDLTELKTDLREGLKDIRLAIASHFSDKEKDKDRRG